jgi:hypothetical protein
VSWRSSSARLCRPRGLPLGRVRLEDIAAAGIERVPKTAGTRGGLPLLDNGRILEVANVIWCTGFVPDFGWIDLPVSLRTAARCTTAASWHPNRACTSWDWSSPMRWPRRWSAGSVGTPSTSPLAAVGRTVSSLQARPTTCTLWELAGGLEPPTCWITRQLTIVHGVLASALLAAPVGWVVQPVRSCRAE